MSRTGGGESAVVLERVTKRYGGHIAVDEVSLAIARGSVHGFIGPNGAGKTSTLRMIMHITLPDAGRVTVLGRPAGRETSQQVGYLPEERGLYPKMRVGALIEYLGQLKGRTRAELKPRIDAWLDRMGLLAWKQKRCQELSKGMQQKVQFIATVVHDPELILLDEPFSGLDPLNAEVLIGIVEEWKRAGKTVIFSTHVMEHAEKLCDAVFMIVRGRKVLDGTLESIRARHREEIVDVEGDGPRERLAQAPGVIRCAGDGGRYELLLRPGADPQELLRHVAGGFRVHRFEVRTPRLHDLFVQLAGDAAQPTSAGGE